MCSRKLNWTSGQTRQALASKLKSEKVSSQFPNLLKIEQCIFCFSYAAFANLRTASLFNIFLINNKDRDASISWKSRKIQCVL